MRGNDQGKQFLYVESASQPTYSIKSTGYLIPSATIFVHNLNNNEDNLAKVSTDLLCVL